MTYEEKNNTDLDSAWDGYKYSIAKFDDQSLLISSGALGISLSFIKEIVPLKDSHFIYLFFLSILCFLATIIIGFISHIVSAGINKKVFDMVLERSEIREGNIEEIKAMQLKIYNYQKRKSKTITGMNKAITYSLLSGLICLVFYCIINISIYRENYQGNHCNCLNSHSNI